MSKHRHNHNRNFHNQNNAGVPTDAAAPVDGEDALAASLGGEDTGEVSDDPNNLEEVEGQNGESSGEVSENADTHAAEQPHEELPPPAQEQEPPAPPPTAEQTKEDAPKPQAVDLEKTPPPSMPVIRYGRSKAKDAAASELAIKRGGQFMKELTEDPRMHTPAGRQLIQMLNEFEDLLTQSGRGELIKSQKSTRKLYDIMVACCPVQGSYASNYTGECIKILFNRMAKGYGKIYKESTLLRVDYTLPSPTDAMKFDSFYTAMYQLVEAAKSGEHIRFNTTALSKVLQSPSAITAITGIRRRLEQR